MATNTTNKAKEVLAWHDRCEAMGHPHSETDQRHYITRRWGDLDLDIQETIHTETTALRAR